MLNRAITRRLFIVPLANNNHGKTHLIRAMVRQGERRDLQVVQRGPRSLASPWGRTIDALVIPRSYQETLAAMKKLVESGDVKIVACYPRAVKWLFHGAGAPLPKEGVEVLNMREQTADDVMRSLEQKTT